MSLSTSSLVYKSVSSFDLLIQCLLFSLKLKDILVKRKSMSDMFFINKVTLAKQGMNRTHLGKLELEEVVESS